VSGGRSQRPSPGVLLAVLVFVTLAARLLAAALAPLTEDEAYYRLWSLRPALGYFDHPPMIAWWIWLGRHIAGDRPLGVRLLPTLSTGATTLLAFAMARLVGQTERVALRAALWLNATLLVGIGGELAVPDAPNGLFWAISVCFGLMALRRPSWWIAAGVAAGLACLSKYSALFLAPGVLFWLAASPAGRRELARPWPWLAILAAIAVFAPNLWWNANHDWMTFAKQFGRVGAGSFDPGGLVKLLSDQVLLLNPLIALFVAWALRRRLAQPFILTSAPFAAYLVLHSLHAEVQGQWPAPLYPSLAVAAAVAAEQAGGWAARARAAAAPFGLAVCAAALLFALAPLDGALPFRDPAAQLRGWPGFFARVEDLRRSVGGAWIGAADYGLAAQLASAPQLHAPAVEIYERRRFTFETPSERANFAAPGLVVVSARTPEDGRKALAGCFGALTPLAPIIRGRGTSATRYNAYLVATPRRDIERTGCYRAGPPNR